jgi:hypothetical protein
VDEGPRWAAEGYAIAKTFNEIEMGKGQTRSSGGRSSSSL